MTAIEHCLSPNYSAGRPAGPPTTITIHHWGVDGQRHDDVVAHLCRANGNTSAHYVVSAGRVTELVSPDDRAWHAGPVGNPRSIGIECRPECSLADIATVADLIRALRARYGHLPLVPHSHWLATACPGRWANRLADLDALAKGAAPTTPAPSTTDEGDDMFIKTTTPWGSTAYAHTSTAIGAEALSDLEAVLYAQAGANFHEVPWDTYQWHVAKAWNDRAALMRDLGRQIGDNIDDLIARVLNATKTKEATK